MPASRILFVTSGVNSPATRYRILPYLPFLRQRGVRCDVAMSIPDKYEAFPLIGWRVSQWVKRRVRLWQAFLAGFKKYDAIVIEREVFDGESWEIEARLRKLTPRIVLDVDDAIYLRYPEKFAVLAQMSNVVIAGNSTIASHAAAYCSDVRIIPTCVDLKNYALPKVHAPTNCPVVGWIGTPSNLPYLESILPALCDVNRHSQFSLRIITDAGKGQTVQDAPGLDVQIRQWKSETAESEVQQFDVGLMPLPDTDWARGKCGFKLLQYMAAGVAPVASPVGVNAEIIVPGQSGFLPVTQEDWRDCLLRLLADDRLRASFGIEARRRVEERYSVAEHVSLFQSVICPGAERPQTSL